MAKRFIFDVGGVLVGLRPELRRDLLHAAVDPDTLPPAERAELEAVQAAGQALEIRVLGLASIDDDVPPALAQATIASVTVLGAFHASAAVKAALAGRMG